MAEEFPSNATLEALSAGTGDSGLPFLTIGQSPHYDWWLKWLDWIDRMLVGIGGALQVYKDGDLTCAVRGGKFRDGDTVRTYAGAVEQELTNNQTNYIYLLADGTLTINITGFPVQSATPHVPLATIVTAAGVYAISDITDYRGAACLGAPMSAAMADLMPNILVTGADDADGTGTATIQVRDAGNNNLAQRFRVRAWISTSDFGAPVAATDFSVTTGTELDEKTADADYEVIGDATGAVVMNIDNGGAGSVYVMAEIDGRIYSSGEIVITA